MEKDLISVIMAIYNCAPTLPEAIESIINQTVTNWQLILCDDCSTDDTYAVAKRYADSDKRIKLIKNETHSMLPYSLNHCLENADGEFIARMDGDDISVPERFEKQIAYLHAHPDCKVVGTAMRRFDGDKLGDIAYCPENPDRYTLHKGLPFNHATIMMRKETYDALGGYTVSKRTVRGQDRDLWFRFFHAGFSGNNLMEPLYMVREDINAIKRRTPYDRFRSYKTTLFGYRLLKYPWYWYIRPTLELSKCLVPSKAMLAIRRIQAKKSDK